jgi:AcrR family transcriptional regulator
MAQKDIRNGHGPAKSRLLNKATHLFRVRGYERTTVRDLAREVGIHSGSIFHHFSSKEAILHAVMEDSLRSLLDRQEAAVDPEATARERLHQLIRVELGSHLGESGEAMSVLVGEWPSLSAESQKELLILRDRYERPWEQALAECVANGDLRGDPVVARKLIAGALFHATTWYRPDGAMSLEDITRQVVTMVVPGSPAG